ncbi:hypothetical protein Indivirus_2_45 [Indivirus ILV1]|uniref:Uncharacterized protein n=1 Tax=Indivirus ILV1 TaxID=1977633 RepID=A0A1V0SD79_9VIRU|nr:hypothetical protein Indivirus_2_45 [Indivirus ILV1]
MSQSEEQLRGIFSLKCFDGGNQAKINHLENVMLKKNEFIGDIKIKEFDIVNDVTGEVYSCNITDTFLMSTRKLPVLYINVIHQNAIQKFLLYKVHLYFTITSDIRSVHDLLDEKISGKFSLEITLDDRKKELCDDTLNQYPGDEKMFEKLENFTKTETMKSLAESLVDEINQRLNLEYGKEFDHLTNKPESFISFKKND